MSTVNSEINARGIGPEHVAIATMNSGENRFNKHGPIRLSHDDRYLMHEDKTPFFWLCVTAWNGALLSTPEEWDMYIKERTRQKFTGVQFVATQWRAAPNGDRKKELAYTGPTNRIVINPACSKTLK